MGEEKQSEGQKSVGLEEFRLAKDEMNLAEFALAGVSSRHADGKRTVVFRDEVWDPELRQYVPRELALSGSGKYGLPTAADDDVLLACLQLSKMQKFKSRTLKFTRYEVLKLLDWSDEGKNYRRVRTSLRRWKGLTVYSDRNFWDHSVGSYADRDFGVIDELSLYERESQGSCVAKSKLVWSGFIWRSCQAGYIKNLDWQFYLGLKSQVAKRLYRLLDKRFWRPDQSRFVFDLRELAFRHVGLSMKKSNAEIIRELSTGIAELESKWDLLAPAEREQRFRKVSRGKWQAVFHRLRPKRKPPRASKSVSAEAAALAGELAKRGVKRNGKTGPDDLVRKTSPERIRRVLEQFDFYQGRGQAKSPGWIVAQCIASEEYSVPPGFAYRKDRRRQAESARDAATRAKNEARQADKFQKQQEAATGQRRRVVDRFLQSLDPTQRESVEALALSAVGEDTRRYFLNAKSLSEGRLLDDARYLLLYEYLLKANGDVKRGAAGSSNG